MPPRAKPKTSTASKPPGALDVDFLEDIAKPEPAKPSAPSEQTQIFSSAQTSSATRQASRVSKHHVSLYISPAVDRAMKRLALDKEKRSWEVYHDAIREYLDRNGVKFDELMRSDG